MPFRREGRISFEVVSADASSGGWGKQEEAFGPASGVPPPKGKQAQPQLGGTKKTLFAAISFALQIAFTGAVKVGGMETPPPLPASHPVPDRDAVRILTSAAFLTILGDNLFWPAPPGLSLTIFALAVCSALVLNRPKAALARTASVAGLLFAGSALQSSIQWSFSNLLVLSLLLLGLVGETSFPTLRTGWPRWSEAAWAFLIAPASWRWAGRNLRRMPLNPRRAVRRAGIFLRVVMPALMLGGLFAMLLGSGNAILARWISEAVRRAWAELPGIDLSLARLGLWLLLATFALALLRPAAPAGSDRLWTHTIPAFPPARDLTIARWRSLAILAVINALFFAANTIDAFYLWIHETNLPVGISYSQFVHQGVHSLVAAVLLSAVVLVAIFQQAAEVIASRRLRALSLVWVAQNVALIASVLLRLKLYVDAYQLSELRVYVGCFLLLVATGFGLLAWRILRGKGLGWLLFANALATFALFFMIQFPDVARWVADYNVARWQQDPRRTLDVDYLESLGPSAYPALIAVAETPNRPEAHEAFQKAQQRKEIERVYLDNLNWRSWQQREVRNARWLLEHEIRTRQP
ncbi:MAG: hypothetical protein QOE70_6065 [Chthoniobacter sp.]|jgi:hypothetical protein|nr:hypothetical protein [Chthoniobacter sp.]